jgi:hypothetical protein
MRINADKQKSAIKYHGSGITCSSKNVTHNPQRGFMFEEG